LGNLSIVVNVRLLIISADSFIARDTSRKVRDHYVVDVSCSGDDGLMLANTNYYDGIIIDNGLTDISGLEMCGIIREDGIASPILMLLEKECACKRGLYLDTGADMCLIKPVEQLLLLSKLRAIARKNCHHICCSSLKIGHLHIDFQDKIILRDDTEITLRRKEYDLFEYLIRNKGISVSKEDLLEHIWDKGMDVASNTVEVHMTRLRKKIESDPEKKLIKTIHGYGYRVDW